MYVCLRPKEGYVCVCVCVCDRNLAKIVWELRINFFLLREQEYLEIADYLKGLNDFLENFGFFPVLIVTSSNFKCKDNNIL